MNDEMKLLIVNNLKYTLVSIEDITSTLQLNPNSAFKIVTNMLRVDIYSIIDEIFDSKSMLGSYYKHVSRSVFYIEDIIALMEDKVYKNRDKINAINYIVALPLYRERVNKVPKEVLDYVRQFKVKKARA